VSTMSIAVSDGLTVARRNAIRLARAPETIFFGLVQPIMFILLFAYVFGGAIAIEGGNYREYLMGGVFVQTVAFSTATTAISVADDLQRGVVDRFRSLPMARSAVLAGRTLADMAYTACVVVVMLLTGLLVGWRIRGSLGEALLAFAVLMLFTFAMLWIGATVGLIAKTVEVAQTGGLIWLFPLTFVSNVFVPLESMPGWLEAVAAWNPISAVAAAVRELFGNFPAGYVPPDYWPLQNPVLASVGWCLLMLAVFVPLSVSKYRQAASR
jgi:ABC-2 type transport system permease protein